MQTSKFKIFAPQMPPPAKCCPGTALSRPLPLPLLRTVGGADWYQSTAQGMYDGRSLSISIQMVLNCV